ncbi:MAG TPA: hypothetical protein VJT33_03445 [bacterium]|nr:hypothetical protein [bacterium]
MTAPRKTLYGLIAITLLGLAAPGPQPAAAANPNCVAVVNTTSQAFIISFKGYDQYTWQWEPNEGLKYVSINGVDIKSPNADGSFYVYGAQGSVVNAENSTWVFHSEMTGGQGNVGTCGGTWALTLRYPGAAPTPAPVPTPPPSGGNYDHPGSCLYVRNTTGAAITIRLNHPSGYEGTWELPSGDAALLAHNGVPIKTPDGNWDVTYLNNSNLKGTWTFDASTTQDGCQGEWVDTL